MTSTKIKNEIEFNPETSKWLKDAIRFNSARNKVEAYRDVEKLYVFARQRVDEEFSLRIAKKAHKRSFRLDCKRLPTPNRSEISKGDLQATGPCYKKAGPVLSIREGCYE